MPSCSRRCISLRSALVAGRDLAASRPIDVDHQRGGRHVLQHVHAERGAVEAVEVLGDGLPVPLGQEAFAHGVEGMASVRTIVSIERSRKSGLQGAKPKPQLPSTTEVTPCQPEIVHHGSQRTWAS